MRNKKWMTLVALAGALSMVAAACGNDNTPPGGASGTPATTAGPTGADTSACDQDQFGCVTYASGEPIKIGTLLAISGDVAFPSSSATTSHW